MRLSCVVLICFWLLSSSSRADIKRWDDGAAIPGTEGIDLAPGADFSGLDLSFAALYSSDLIETLDLTGARIRDANLASAYLYNTNLTDADLSGTDLTNVLFGHWLTHTSVRNVNFSDTRIEGASLVWVEGFVAEQLYSTASYAAKDLSKINLMYSRHLAGWNFAGQGLQEASFDDATMTGTDLQNASLFGASLAGADLTQADLSGADLRNTCLNGAWFEETSFSQDTTYNHQWTVFPERFDPVDEGLTFIESSLGDFDANDRIDANDFDRFESGFGPEYRFGASSLSCTYLSMFDLDSNGQVDDLDHAYWVNEINNTWFGDANLDGEFNSADLVAVFVAGEYEDSKVGNSGWASGDWNSDSEFNSGDLIRAFQEGGYENSPRRQAVAIPEPSGFPLIATSIFFQRKRCHFARVFC